MQRSKTVWLRGWIRIRCAECNWLMMRSRQWFGRDEEEIVTCPKCKTTTWAFLPPKKNKIPWPPRRK
jgi:ssDNA-binding Zn-finger/Zn-ribbon topoisomerase 1